MIRPYHLHNLSVGVWHKTRGSNANFNDSIPRQDGYDVAKRIREIEQCTNMKRTPVIALSAATLKEDKERALAAGFDDYMTYVLLAVFVHEARMSVSVKCRNNVSLAFLARS